MVRALGAALLAVGALVAPGAASAATTCRFDPVSGVLQVEVDGSVGIGAVDGAIIVSPPGAAIPCGDPTTLNTEAIVVTADGVGDDWLRLDALQLVPGRTREATGRSEIEVIVGGVQVLDVDGGPGADHIALGTLGAATNRDNDVDVVILPSVQGVRAIGEDGNDVLTARGGYGSGGVLARGVSLYGSAEDDVLIGGDGDDYLSGCGCRDQFFSDSDVLRGGRGNDILVSQFGPDFLSGGVGDDTLFADNGASDRVRGGIGIDAAYIDCTLDTVSAVESLSTPCA
jgi:Ca2+-binding RTX toxin-like protein